MAEINVERKKNVWPWIVGLIVLLLAIWGAMELMNTDERRAYTDPALGSTTIEPVTAPAAQQPVIGQEPMPATTPADTATTGDVDMAEDVDEIADDVEDTADRTSSPPPPEL